ncbi:unnamed protein product [Orchesella dallaii]|uniref:Uncharacterized protein n=1 Tax=Orchesella dallaii TaxID=48710 RepID=A0ABP1QY32_9HEXA
MVPKKISVTKFMVGAVSCCSFRCRLGRVFAGRGLVGDELVSYGLKNCVFIPDLSNKKENYMTSFITSQERKENRSEAEKGPFPLGVTVVSGVMYSPSLKVILESFKKIREFKQTKIDPVMVYSNYVQVPHRLRVPREALRDAMYMNAQPMDEDEDDVEVFQDPIPIPQRPASARGGSHQERDAHEREPSQGTSRNTQEEFRTPY